MKLVHNIRKFEDIKIFTHCPYCKKDWFKETKQITNGISQITDTKLINVENRESEKPVSYEINCDCGFQMQYIVFPFERIEKDVNPINTKEIT